MSTAFAITCLGALLSEFYSDLNQQEAISHFLELSGTQIPENTKKNVLQKSFLMN
jgi:hypothetical protein